MDNGQFLKIKSTNYRNLKLHCCRTQWSHFYTFLNKHLKAKLIIFVLSFIKIVNSGKTMLPLLFHCHNSLYVTLPFKFWVVDHHSIKQDERVGEIFFLIHDLFINIFLLSHNKCVVLNSHYRD